MGPKRNKKTPTKANGSFDDVSFHSDFSPVKISESPGQARQGNLTGSARKLKDGAADLHNQIQIWNVHKTDGSNVISEIANIKLEKILGQSDDVDHESSMLPESLLPLCEKLNKLLLKMEKIASKLSGLADMCKGVAELERYRGGSTDSILFQTWNMDKFESVFKEISVMYQKELKMKRCVLENICHCVDRNSVMFYNATWIHEPYIDINVTLLLDSILLETRHKT